VSGVPCLIAIAVAAVAAAVPSTVGAQTETAILAVDGDRISEPLENRIGDAARGKAIVLDRRVGNCLICHRVPVPQEPFQGEIGPDLSGIGDRLSSGQIRLRVVDSQRFNPATLMPPYHRIERLRRVAPAFVGQPALTAQEVEDVIAWLASLK
jgi:L-cysteine S-thiosulfotransferase